MDVYVIVLRILHIVSGVFWVGSAYLFFFFLEPSVHATGPAGGQFMKHVTEHRKAPIFIVGSSAVTVIAGLLLYWRTSGGFDADWVTSGPGLAFTTGGIAAIIAFLLGAIFVKPLVDGMSALGGEIAASGGQPSEAQLGQMQRIQGRLRAIGRLDVALVTIAVIAMAIARYL